MRKYLIYIFILLLAGCTNYAKVQKMSDPLARFEASKELYAERHYNQAATILNDLIIPMKGTERGEECLFLLGMTNYKAKNYDAAAEAFQRYYKTYPRGAYAESAMFYSGMSLYNLTPEPRLDQSGTFTAITELTGFLEAYPSSPRSWDVQQRIFELQDKLVEKEYLNAKLYYDLGTYFGNCTSGGSNYQACIVTAENALKEYLHCDRREDLSILILKSKFELAQNSVLEKKRERYQDAIDEFYNFQIEYPESKFLPDAQKMYEKAKKYETKEIEE